MTRAFLKLWCAWTHGGGAIQRGVVTRLALAHYAAAALFVAPVLAHATGLTPGTEDPHVARWIAEDVIADDRSALTLDGQGVRFVGGDGLSGSGGDTTTPVPVPPMLPVFAIALAALIWKG